MFNLPTLSYDFNALEPHIDAQTMEIHLTKHHKAYTDNLNNALKDTEFENKPIEWVLANLDKMPQDKKMTIQNNAGGFANHNLFWEIMTPNHTPLSEGKLMTAINATFGSVESVESQMNDAGLKRFGSGWTWLVSKDNRLEIISTANQDSPLMQSLTPIIGIDVWEHAYYLNYQNRRADYLKAWWNVVNWKKIEENFEKVNTL